jgi:hypothetical protein
VPLTARLNIAHRTNASAGPIVPKPVVTTAMTIDATAIVVMLAIGSPLVAGTNVPMDYLGFSFRLADPRGGHDVNRSQDAEDVGLHHAGLGQNPFHRRLRKPLPPLRFDRAEFRARARDAV